MIRTLIFAACAWWAPQVVLSADAGEMMPKGDTKDAGVKAPQDNQPPKPKIAKGPPPAAKMECAPNPIQIGQPLICTLTIIHRADVSITVTSPSDIETLKPEPAKPHGEGQLKSIRQLKIMPNSMKKVHIKELAITWTESDESVGELPIPEQRVVVSSMMVGVKSPQPRTYSEPQDKTEQFFESHGPTPYRVTNWILIISLLVIFGGGFCVLLGIWLNRWLRARKRVELPWVDPRPAHVIAFEALEKLVTEHLPEQGLNEEYYVRLSEIVRGYFKRRYDINGLEMTSEEITVWAQQARLSEEAKSAISYFLYETDIVKFANVKPSVSEIDAITIQATALIELTQLVETEDSVATESTSEAHLLPPAETLVSSPAPAASVLDAPTAGVRADDEGQT
jgi:hypothetical protein